MSQQHTEGVVPHTLRFFLFNCTGLTKEKVLDIYETLHQYDILLFTETWSRSGQDLPIIEGFQSISQNRVSKNENARRGSGGVAVYFKTSLAKYISIWQPKQPSTFVDSCMWFKVSNGIGLEKDLYACIVYAQATSSKSVDYRAIAQADLFEWLTESIAEASILGHMFLAGDFNARTADHADFYSEDLELIAPFLPEYQDSSYVLSATPNIPRNSKDSIVDTTGRELLDMCKATQSIIFNGRCKGDEHGAFTFANHKGNSVVDYFIGDQQLYDSVQSLLVNPLEAGSGSSMGGHHSLSLSINLKKKHMPIANTKMSDILSIKWNQDLVEQYQQTLHTQLVQKDFHNLLNSSGDIDSLGKQLQDIISTSAADIFGVRKVPKQTVIDAYLGFRLYLHKPWFDEECRQCRKHLRFLLNTEPQSNTTLQARRQYRRITQRKRKVYARQRTEQLVEAVKQTPARFWRQFNSHTKTKAASNISEEQWTAHFQALLNPPNSDATSTDEQLPANVSDDGTPPINTIGRCLNANITTVEVEYALKQ